MRAAFFALMAVGTFFAVDTGPAAARSQDLPYCMHTMWGDDDCSYYNYQQCFVTSQGLGTSCFANPALAYNSYQEDQPAPRRKSRRRSY